MIGSAWLKPCGRVTAYRCAAFGSASVTGVSALDERSVGGLRWLGDGEREDCRCRCCNADEKGAELHGEVFLDLS